MFCKLSELSYKNIYWKVLALRSPERNLISVKHTEQIKRGGEFYKIFSVTKIQALNIVTEDLQSIEIFPKKILWNLYKSQI